MKGGQGCALVATFFFSTNHQFLVFADHVADPAWLTAGAK
jgi:hypothetical protein